MRYVRPKSVTWWAGVAAIVLGVLSAVMPDSLALSEFGRVVSILMGGDDASPAGLIVLGVVAIGLRDKLERERLARLGQ